MFSDQIQNKIMSGMNYADYTTLISQKAAEYSISEPGSTKHKLYKLNISRTKRIENTFLFNADLKELLESINDKQTWLILTEPWCGDSAQNIPYIASIATLNPLIELKLLLRDDNPDVMDLYLTNNTRSIPVLIAFDKEWNELFRWGSRPAPAKELVSELKNKGADKKLIEEKLHAWYAGNKGKDITNEICEILRTVLTSELL